MHPVLDLIAFVTGYVFGVVVIPYLLDLLDMLHYARVDRLASDARADAQAVAAAVKADAESVVSDVRSAL